jgi:2-C-methyl-D-erythritol 4-phosphate cytidylyltransferase
MNHICNYDLFFIYLIMEKIIVIVAGGLGTRMQSEIPKQFLLIAGRPILMHTLQRFYDYNSSFEIRLVLPDNQQERWKGLCDEHAFEIPHTLYEGGDTRYRSVKNGTQGIESGYLVAIHDGVRPFVSHETIDSCFEIAEKYGTAIPAIPVKESIREIIKEDTVGRNRANYRLVQTPQVFHSDILFDAYQRDYKESFTDDASVVEEAGYKIYLAEGNEENIKITTPEDIMVAERFAKLEQFR